MTTIQFYVGDTERGSKSFELSVTGSEVMEYAKTIIQEYSEYPSLLLKYNVEGDKDFIWYRAQSLDEFLDALFEKNSFHGVESLKIHVSPPKKREPVERPFSVDSHQEKRIATEQTNISVVKDFHTAQDEHAKLVKFPILEALPYPQLSKCAYHKEKENILFFRIGNFAGQFRMYSTQFQNLSKHVATRIEIYYTSKIENIEIPVEQLIASLAFGDDKDLPETAKLLRSVLHLASGTETAIDPKWDLSLDSIQQIHGDIMKTDTPSFPGVFRPNSIGGVGGWQAPHSSKITQMMENLIDFHNNSSFPTLFTGVLCHLHFEAIHPFNDGNGRLGRVLLLHSLAKLFDTPEETGSTLALFISLEIMKDRPTYYKCLSEAINEGKIQKYVDWFLEIIDKSLTNSLAFLDKLQTELDTLPYCEGLDNQLLAILKSNGAIMNSGAASSLAESLQQFKADGIVSSVETNNGEVVVLSFLCTLLQEYCT